MSTLSLATFVLVTMGLLMGSACSLVQEQSSLEQETEIRTPSSCVPPAAPAPSGVVAFTNVHVVPVTAGSTTPAVWRNQTVVVRDGRIEAIGTRANTPIPEKAVQIDGRGDYLIPGLADMHAHVAYPRDAFAFLAFGVTTVRLMWGSERQLALRSALREGAVVGPRLYIASPGLDGAPSPWPNAELPTTPAEGRATVRRLKREGYDFIKVYTRLPAPVYEAVVEEAAREDLPVVGHVPVPVGLAGTLAAPQASIEHLDGLAPLITKPGPGLPWERPLDMDQLAIWAERIRASGTWIVPTQVVVNRSASMQGALEDDPLFAALSPSFRAFQSYPPARLPTWDPRRALAQRAQVIQALSEAGVPLMAGSDTGVRYVFPGAGLHEELALLAEAGLSPFEVLVAATAAPRVFLGALAPGEQAIDVGRPADLVLVGTNPTEVTLEPAHVRGVYIRNQWWPSSILREHLEAFSNCDE